MEAWPMTGLFALVSMLSGCFGGGGKSGPVDGVPEPTPNATPSPEPPTEAAPTAGYVVGKTTVRKIASDDRKIADPAGGDKQVSNYVTALNRGEKVDITGNDGDWTHIKASDGSDGWLKTNRLVVEDEKTKVATLFAEGKVFDRPDLLALAADRKIEAGSLVFVLSEKDQFSEVDYPKTAVSDVHAWALSSDLTTDPNEVEAAKLIAKVRELRADNDPAAKQMEDLARSQYSNSKLLSLLDQPVEATPPDGATDGGTPPGGQQ
jgi:SH3-like domain-containing protein